MKTPHTPQDLADEVEPAKPRPNQPYASELEDRALERAQKEKRPLAPEGESVSPSGSADP